MKTIHRVFAVIYFFIGVTWFIYGSVIFLGFDEYHQTALNAYYGILVTLGILFFSFLHWATPEETINSKGSKLFIAASIINYIILAITAYTGFNCRNEGCLAVYMPLLFLFISLLFTLLVGTVLLGRASKKAIFWIAGILLGLPVLLYIVNGIFLSL